VVKFIFTGTAHTSSDNKSTTPSSGSIVHRTETWRDLLLAHSLAPSSTDTSASKTGNESSTSDAENSRKKQGHKVTSSGTESGSTLAETTVRTVLGETTATSASSNSNSSSSAKNHQRSRDYGTTTTTTDTTSSGGENYTSNNSSSSNKSKTTDATTTSSNNTDTDNSTVLNIRVLKPEKIKDVHDELGTLVKRHHYEKNRQLYPRTTTGG
jgi:hypothetical protein